MREFSPKGAFFFSNFHREGKSQGRKPFRKALSKAFIWRFVSITAKRRFISSTAKSLQSVLLPLWGRHRTLLPWVKNSFSLPLLVLWAFNSFPLNSTKTAKRFNLLTNLAVKKFSSLSSSATIGKPILVVKVFIETAEAKCQVLAPFLFRP